MNRTERQLLQFAGHLRDPGANPPPPGVEHRRLAVYRELVANNLRALLAGNFPVIRATLGDTRWQALVNGFQSGHRSRTPLFTRIGGEFVDFLHARAQVGSGDPPWLAELAHYEYAELALQVADDALPAHDPAGDLLHGIPVRSPFAWALAYRWPVHQVGPGAEPVACPDPPTLLLLRRDAAGDVRFSELSPLVFRLLELIDGRHMLAGDQLLRQLAEEASAPDASGFMRAGKAMLQRLRDEGTLLGTVAT